MEELNFNNEEKQEAPKTHSHKPKYNLTKTLRKNPWMLSTFVLGVLSIILLIGLVGNFSLTGNVSQDEIAENLLSFYEANGASGLEFDSIEEMSGVYKVNFLYNGQTVPIFATKDGKFAGSLNPIVDPTATPEPKIPEVVKSDKPKVELFVMTHCPYGTQAEKGIIPAFNELGNLIDSKIEFVHYFMHDPEETETPRQVCIREEQSDKYTQYLTCFLEDGDYERCLTETGIDTAAMNECIDSGKWEDYYNADSELSQGYGVQGSPTLVINGAQVSSSRDSASYLTTICAAFNEAPAICETAELSTASPTPMWGWDGTSSGTTAQC